MPRWEVDAEAGFEPAAAALWAQCSTKLSYPAVKWKPEGQDGFQRWLLSIYEASPALLNAIVTPAIGKSASFAAATAW